MNRLLFSVLAFVCMVGRAQTQEPLDSVDRLFELKEVVVRGGLPNTRLKGNSMITRIEVIRHTGRDAGESAWHDWY